MTEPRRDLVQAFGRILARSGAPEPDVLAAELVTAAQGRGWRHVEALDPAPDTGPAAPPHRAHAHAAAARAALRAATHPTGGDPT